MATEQDQPKKQSKSFGSIFRLITSSPTPLTMKQIATELGVSLPTVYQGVNELIAAGLVRSCGAQSSSGGRRPASVSVNALARIALGISVTGEQLNTVAVDLQGSPLYSSFIACTAPRDATTFKRLIDGEIDRFLGATSFSRRLLLGAVVAIPGIVDNGAGVIEYAPIVGLSGTPTTALTSGQAIAVSIENDALCGGYAEQLTRHDLDSMAYLSLERGVGGSLFFNGEPYTGKHGRSAEFGHICVEPGGRECTCGKRGCLESYCSSARLERASGMPLAQYFDALATGDVKASEIWEDYLVHLARGIVTITTAFDCDVVVGGPVARYLPPHLDEIRTRVHELDPFAGHGTDVLLSDHPRDAIPLGAALMLVNDFIRKA